MTARATLLTDLRRETGCKDDIALMNWLQNRGLVSDCAVTVDDVPVSDLNRALRCIQRGGAK